MKTKNYFILIFALGLFTTVYSARPQANKSKKAVLEEMHWLIERSDVQSVRIGFITGKLIPFIVIALFDLAFGLLIARLVFNLPIVGSLWLVFGLATVYLIGILGLGLFISTVADTQQQVMFVTYFFMMIFILMGGIFTPVDSMPHWAQAVDEGNPVYHFMRIMRMVVLKGSTFSDLIHEFIALSVIGLTFLSLAIWRYRKTV